MLDNLLRLCYHTERNGVDEERQGNFLQKRDSGWCELSGKPQPVASEPTGRKGRLE